jgi:DNA polymerase III gamma/tau subunit
MLTKEASNALLKVLEEPPAGVVFVLCTTEEDKILATIKSRCQIHNLSLVPNEILAKHLLKIAELESIVIDSKTAEFVAMQAKGSVRDGISFLDKFKDLETVNIDNIKEHLGLIDQSYLIDFMKLLGERKVGQLFLIIDLMSQMSINLETFILEVEEFLQNINYKNNRFDNISYRLFNDVEKLCNLFTPSFLIQCFDSLSKWRSRFLPFSKLNLEVAVTEICLFEQPGKIVTPQQKQVQTEMPMDWMTIKKETPKPQPTIKEEEDDF